MPAAAPNFDDRAVTDAVTLDQLGCFGLEVGLIGGRVMEFDVEVRRIDKIPRRKRSVEDEAAVETERQPDRADRGRERFVARPPQRPNERGGLVDPYDLLEASDAQIGQWAAVIDRNDRAVAENGGVWYRNDQLRPPLGCVCELGSRISRARFHGKITITSGLVSAIRSGGWIGIWVPGVNLPCLYGLRSTV